jgi:hypothetical protein
MKKLIQNLSIMFISLIATLAVCEVGARLLLPPPMSVQAVTVTKRTFSEEPTKEVTSDDGSIFNLINWHKSAERGVRLHPNVTATLSSHTLSKQPVTLRINSYGMRGPQLGPKEPGEFRILNIGDSITFGDYLEEALTIPALLEKRLAPHTTKVVVLNAGLPGANAADEYYHYLELQEAVKPDLVFLGMYLNDAQESGKFYAKQLRFPFSKSRFLTWFVQRFQLIDSDKLFGGFKATSPDEGWRDSFRNARDLKPGNMYGTRDGFDFEIYNAHKDFGLAWNPEGWAQLNKIVGTWVQVAHKNNQQFAAYLFPVKMQIFASDTALSTYPQESFMKMCKEFNIPCLDLLPLIRAEVKAKNIRDSDLLYDHCHYKAPGNEIVAEKLTEWMVSSKLLTPYTPAGKTS